MTIPLHATDELANLTNLVRTQGDTIQLLAARVIEVENRCTELENRKEVRIHANVKAREQKIIDYLNAHPGLPMTAAQLQVVLDDEKGYDAVAGTCRRLAEAKRIAKVELAHATRTPHYVALPEVEAAGVTE